jgi:hypothetical protein
MKNLIFCLLFSITTAVPAFAQSGQDSIATQIGSFVLVSSETIYETTQLVEDSTSTVDGGTTESVALFPGRVVYQEQISLSAARITATVTPNPASGDCKLSIENIFGDFTVVISDVAGRVVFQFNGIGNERTSVILPSSLWHSGVYMINVSGESGMENIKLLVKE